MANWSLPSLTDLYQNVIDYLKGRDLDLAKGLDPAKVTVGNPVADMIRWNSANGYWEIFNGTSWVALASTYAINAATASKMATARTINGTNFDGSAAIITANWGTARAITVGNAVKSVDGSTAVSWSLSEIGAVPIAGNVAMTGPLTLFGDATAALHPVTKQQLDTKLAASSYTAADVRTKLLTVDGVGSGIDADLLDGYHATTGTAASAIPVRDASGNLPGNITGAAASCTGNAATASKLATARTITISGAVSGSASFDGSANISISVAANGLLDTDMGHNNVGSLCFAAPYLATVSTIAPGGTIAGSSLRPVGALPSNGSGIADSSLAIYGTALSGTWRCLGHTGPVAFDGAIVDTGFATLWQRIS